ncbi:DUF3298 and DUF4163 domain-containing protein [Paenibacillus anseongense]|uniref:DUF3298 and DUF4163 domain-containing protein n=1 Tax=Paenibacillus anseongense TaxID=2682845 RepID=UPI002DBC1BD2|nr:DUF3298 domain-containing protein [Paenibacillus anseongense]MEC0265113.1 DUF3298 domain-containing protein [Paenibacillus anseongense]
MDRKLEEMKQQYMDVPIPKELDFIVTKAIQRHTKKKRSLKWLTAAAAAAIIFVAGINTSPAFAHALSEVPLVGNLIKVLTFREYMFKDQTYEAKLEVPVITDMKNKELQESLNQKYQEEAKKQYQEFMTEMDSMKAAGSGGHLGVNSGYVVKTDNDRILSVGRYVVNMVGSSSTTFQYDTIDKKKEILITLPSLFMDERYIEVISENIKSQMNEQMKLDQGKVYWVEGSPAPVQMSEVFKSIKKDQNFYINSDGQLVISFQKYEVAPGYMGVPEFVIPTRVLSDLLVSKDEYLR